MNKTIMLMLAVFLLVMSFASARDKFTDCTSDGSTTCSYRDDYNDANTGTFTPFYLETNDGVIISSNALCSALSPTSNTLKISDRLNVTYNYTDSFNITQMGSVQNMKWFLLNENITSLIQNPSAGHGNGTSFALGPGTMIISNWSSGAETVIATIQQITTNRRLTIFLNDTDFRIMNESGYMYQGTHGFRDTLRKGGFTFQVWATDTNTKCFDDRVINITFPSIAEPDPPVISNFIAPGGTNTSDTTPQVTLDTDIDATCNLSITNVSNWFGFSTTGGTSHVGTVSASDPLSIGYPQNVSVNCTSEDDLSTYATLQFNITDGFTPNVVINNPPDSSVFKETVNQTVRINFTTIDNYFSTLNCNLSINGVVNQSNTSVVSGQPTDWDNITFGVGSYDFNVSCVDGHGNGNSSQRSLSVEVIVCTAENIILYLNGINDSRKYEFGSSVNISANGTGTYDTGGVCNVTVHVDINAPNYGVNYSNANTSTTFFYNITVLRQTELSDYNISTTGGNVTVSIDNRTDLISGSFNISGTNLPSNIVIQNEGTIIAVLPDYLNSTNLTHKIFTHSNTNYNSTNISYSTAGTETIFINMTASGNIYYNITFTLTGFEVDELNEGDAKDNFTNASIYPINSNMSVFGFYDNMEDKNVNDWWDFTLSGDDLVNAVCNISSGNTDDYLEHKLPSGRYTSGKSTTCVSTNEGDSNFDLKNLSKTKIDGYWTHQAWRWNEITSCTGTGKVIITDGANSVTVKTLFVGVNEITIIKNFNITLDKISQDSWSWVYEQNDGSTDSGTVNFASLDDSKSWYYKFFTEQSNSADGRDCAMNNQVWIYDIKQNGISINRTYDNPSYQGNTSYIISDIVLNATYEYVAAWLFVSEYLPTGTSARYYLSADNGTSWQGITKSERNIFATQGTNISFKVNISTGNENRSPVIYDAYVRVIPASITDIEIDAGDDGDVDWNRSGVLNSSTGYWNVSIYKDEAFDYADDYSSNENFMFPISISTGSEGLLQVSGLTSIQNPNPIVMNVTPLEDCSNCKIGTEFTGGALNFTGLMLDSYGSWNYTALVHTSDYGLNDSHKIMVKYSKHNCTYPKGVNYYEPYPIMSNNDKNVTPYGQEINYHNTSVDYYSIEASIPIFNCSYYGYDEIRANFTISVNDTQNGIDLWLGYNVSKDQASNITTEDKYIFQVNRTAPQGIWGWTDLFNASLDSIYSYYPNITFNVYCEECLHG